MSMALDAAARTAGAFQFEEQQEPLLEREIGVMWIGGLFSQSFPKSGQAGSLSLVPDLNETFLVMNGGVLTQVD
jgi:hypothetical protein